MMLFAELDAAKASDRWLADQQEKPWCFQHSETG